MHKRARKPMRTTSTTSHPLTLTQGHCTLRLATNLKDCFFISTAERCSLEDYHTEISIHPSHPTYKFEPSKPFYAFKFSVAYVKKYYHVEVIEAVFH